MIYVVEGGKKLTFESETYEFDLNEVLNKYWIYRQSDDHKTKSYLTEM